MATAGELLARLNLLADDDVPSDKALLLFNRALEDLSSTEIYRKQATTAVTADVDTYALPPDFIEAAEVLLDGQTIYPAHDIRIQSYFYPETGGKDWPYDYDAWERFGNEIRLLRSEPKDGTLLLRYYAVLPPLQSLSDAPALPQQFHDLLVLYAVMSWRQGERDELAEVADYRNQYLLGKAALQEYADLLRRQESRRATMPRRPWA